MKLEYILEMKTPIIDKKSVECKDKTCSYYGQLVRCYAKDYYDKCKYYIK